MGQEISHSQFNPADFQQFTERLRAETQLLSDWFAQDCISHDSGYAGLELEAWLIDSQLQAAPANGAFLQALADPDIVPELAQFNFELNSTPLRLQGDSLRRIHAELAGRWFRCMQAATPLSLSPLLIGILPTLQLTDLNLNNITPMQRYNALNEQVLAQRQARPLQVDITGRSHLYLEHHNVMLESATTSLQIHLQVSPEQGRRLYNASIVASAPVVAVAANSPYLFGHDLWEETRIPLFERSVEVGGYDGVAHGPLRRVSFGTGYCQESLLECFIENRDHYPALLPMLFDDPPEALSHLRLHNGTIWRWNRPLVGFHQGQPHIRLEHRTAASGPSIIDVVANVAFFMGLVHEFAHSPDLRLLDLQLPFATARENFYHASRYGLQAKVTWINGQRHALKRLILEQFLPAANRGLNALGIDEADRRDYLGIIEARVRTGRTGSYWQRSFVEQHGNDMQALTAAYLAHQHSSDPVHSWTLGS